MTLINAKIAFIGAGNMGAAILAGLLNAKTDDAKNIICADIDAARLSELSSQYGIQTTTEAHEAVQKADIAVLAVKPQILPAIMPKIIDFFNKEKLIITIAAGIPLAYFEALTPKPLRMVRAMPNIAATVNATATALCAGAHAEARDMDTAKVIFGAIGEVVTVADEKLMDAVTGLSGSGPAFIFQIAEAMADAGVKMGLNRAQASLLANQTILGAARMLLETGLHPGALKDMVTSPAGTTIAGVATMEEHGVRAGIIAAVEAATLRSKELSELVKINREKK